MRTLLLMRHAKSSWQDATLSDDQRPLKERGKAAAKTIGRLMRRRRLKPDLVLVSPAKRAQQTVKRVLKAADGAAPIVTSEALYFKGAEAHINAIRAAASNAKTVLVVGHNPDLEDLLKRLTGQREQMPTAALAVLRVDAGWDELKRRGRCRLDAIYRPKELPDED